MVARFVARSTSTVTSPAVEVCTTGEVTMPASTNANAVPSVGWPANAISSSGVKIRTS